MRGLSASVELEVQKLVVEKQSAVVAAVVVAAVVGDHYSPSELLYVWEDANTCTFLCDTVPKNNSKQ